MRSQAGKTFTMAKAAVSTANHVSANLSNQQNWELLGRWKSLPPAFPAWRQLTDERQWTWRVLHLNHLNLLLLVYQDHEKRLTTKSDFHAWKRKGQYWFGHLGQQGADPDGRSTLEQLLNPEEGYPSKFRQWLFDEIVPKDLFANGRRPKA